jgi:hypothetical protein
MDSSKQCAIKAFLKEKLLEENHGYVKKKTN